MKITWQYVAGFFDGEGCIAVSGYGNIYPRITFCQSSMPVLVAISEFLLSEGISSAISGRRNNKAPANYLANYVLTIKGGTEQSIVALKRMLPYLIVKKCKAQDMIRFKALYPRRKRSLIRPIEATVNPVIEYSWNGFSKEPVTL